MKPILYIVIPCYNEEEVLPITCQMFLDKIKSLIEKELIDNKSRIMFVNDGSKDKTWDIIQELSLKDDYYIGICQSRNRGHQNAVLAGLMEAKEKCDITISIDCDGQDDINAMDEMIKEYLNGAEIVYGVRSKRDTDTFFKRLTAQGFYKFLNWMGADVVYNHADYRLVSSQVLEEFSSFKEVNLFLRGMFPLVGFKSTSVYYERHERIAGESHYPLKKMLALAFDGITSLSVKPIRMVMTLGIIIVILSILGALSLLVTYFTQGKMIQWIYITTIVFLVGGIELVGMGIIGEYIGKIYMEVKARPRYIISDRTYQSKNNRGHV